MGDGPRGTARDDDQDDRDDQDVSGGRRPGRDRFGLDAIRARPIGGGQPSVTTSVTCLYCQTLNTLGQSDGTTWCVNETGGRHVLNFPPD